MSPGLAVGGLVGLMASVGLIATVSHISSERPSPPAVGGGAPGAVAALQGVGAAARGLLSPTTTESLVGRVLHGGMPGLGGRFGAPIEPKTTATTPHTTSRSTGRPDIRRTTWSLGLTTVATPFASGRTRVTSTRFPTAKTTVKTHRKSTDKRDRLGNMHLDVGTSVTYGEPTTGHSKTSAKWRIVREPSVMSLVGSRSSTKQPSNVLPVFAEEPSKVSLTRGQQPDTTAVAMETSDAPVKPPNEVYHTTAAETHETNFKEIGLALDTTSSRYKITEVLETEATTGAVNHANSRAVTNPYNQKEYATFTDRIAELTTGDIFGGGRADQYAKQPHVTGSGQIHQRGTTATTQATDAVRSTRGVPQAAVSTAPITATGENTHQLGEATIYGTGEDSSDYPGEVKADTEVTEVSGSVTLSSSKPGDVTTWSPSVIQRTRQDTTDAATVLSSEPNDDDTVVRPTRNPKGKTTQPAMSSFQTDSFNPIKTTNDDRPSTMIPSYRRTPQRISDGTTADTLIKHTPHHPTLATETTYNTKETPPPVVGATADDPTMNETGETVAREGGPSTTDEFTSQAIVTSTSREREDTVPSATLSQSYSSRSMSPLRRLKDIDRTDAWRPVTSPSVVPIEVTAENNEEERSSTSSVVSPSDIDNNDNLYSPSTHKKLSSYTSTHAPFSHNNADTTPLTSAGSRTTHEPLYRSTNSYAQREHTSPDAHDGSVSEVKSGTPLHQSSSVAFVIKPSTDSLSTTLTPSKHSDSTTDMSVQMPHVPGTRTALHERTSSDEPVSMTATYPGTTDKTTVDRPGYKRHLPTTGRDPYTGHVTETQHTGSTQNNIVSKIPSPTDESSTETTMDTGNTEDVRSLMTTHAVNLTRSAINADAVIRPATANMTQGCNDTEYGVWIVFNNVSRDHFDVIKAAIKVVIAGAVDRFCHQHPAMCCSCYSVYNGTYDYGDTTDVRCVPLKSDINDTDTRVFIMAATSGLSKLCNMSSHQNAPGRLKRDAPGNRSTEARAVPSRVLRLVLQQPHVLEEIANVIHASFPMLVISVVVTTNQTETAVMPTVHPNLDNEDVTPTSPSVPQCHESWLVCVVVFGLVGFIGLLAMASYIAYLKRPTKVVPIHIMPV